MLRSLPNLSGSPHLQVVDLSHCCMLEDLGDIGPLRSLQYLYLQNCRSLRTLRELGSPCLKGLDLSCCSKVEDLGNFDSPSSLQMLNLNECVSLRTMPNLSNSSVLEVLNVKGCVRLSALSQMTTSYLVIDVSECWSLERIPILNDLAKLELDVTVGDINGEAVENMELFGAVLRLKLKCQGDTSRHQTSEKVEMWTQRFAEILRSRDLERQKQRNMERLKQLMMHGGLMEVLRFNDAEMEELFRSKNAETRLMQMLLSEEVEELMHGLMDMLISEEMFTWMHDRLMLRLGNVETWIEGLVDMLSSVDTKTRMQSHTMHRSRDVETWKQDLMVMFCSEDIETRKQGLMEMFRFEDYETWKECFMMFTSTDVETSNHEKSYQGLIEMLSFRDVERFMKRLRVIDVKRFMKRLRSKDVERQKEGLMEMLRSKDVERQKLGLMGMLSSEDVEIQTIGILVMLRSRKFQIWKQGLMEMLQVLLLGVDECAAANDLNDLLLIQSCGNDRHFKNMCGLLDPEKWIERQFVFPQLTNVKFQSISISSASITILPSSNFCSTRSRLEITKCRRLRCLSNLHLRALEALVTSQWDELESLPDLSTSTALKHLTIRDFRAGPRFRFLSHLSRPPHTYPKRWRPCSDFKNLVELIFDNCVGLGGLEHWGPLPALESLVIRDCNTITGLPDLRRSSELSRLVVMNCGRLRKTVDVGSGEALRMCRVEGCGNEKLRANYISSREELCLELKNVLGYTGVSGEFTRWLRRGEIDSFHLDMFSGFDFSLVPFAGPSLEEFNLLLEQWALRVHN